MRNKLYKVISLVLSCLLIVASVSDSALAAPAGPIRCEEAGDGTEVPAGENGTEASEGDPADAAAGEAPENEADSETAETTETPVPEDGTEAAETDADEAAGETEAAENDTDETGSETEASVSEESPEADAAEEAANMTDPEGGSGAEPSETEETVTEAAPESTGETAVEETEVPAEPEVILPTMKAYYVEVRDLMAEEAEEDASDSAEVSDEAETEEEPDLTDGSEDAADADVLTEEPQADADVTAADMTEVPEETDEAEETADTLAEAETEGDAETAEPDETADGDAEASDGEPSEEEEAAEDEPKNTLTFYYDSEAADAREGVLYEVPLTVASAEDIPWAEIAGNVEEVIFDDSFSTEIDPDMPEMIPGVQPTTTAYWFRGFKNLEKIDLSNLDTTFVTDMTGMFEGCGKLETIYVNERWNTVSVLASEGMFAGCEALAGPCGTALENAVEAGINGDDIARAVMARVDTFVTLGVGTPGYLTLANIKDISKDTIEVSGQVYNGAPWVPEVTLMTPPIGNADGRPVDPANYEISFFTDAECETEIAPTEIVNAGTYYVQASGRGEMNYTGTTLVKGFEIEKAMPTLTVSEGYLSLTYGETAELAVSYTGDAELTFTSEPADAAVFAYHPETGTVSVTAAKAGNASITVGAPESDNFLAISAVISLEVRKVSVQAPTAKKGLVYIGTEQLGFNVYENQLFTLENYTAAEAGEYEATAVLKDKENYVWADGGTEDLKIPFSIGPRKAVITPNELKKAYGEDDPVFTAIVAGEVNGEKIGYKLEREEGENVGGYIVNVIPDNSKVNKNYQIESPEIEFVIEKAMPTLTLWPDSWVVGKDSTVTTVVVFDSDAELEIVSSDDNIATAAYDAEKKQLTISGHAPGSVTLTLSAKETDNYLAPEARLMAVGVTEGIDKTTLNAVIAFALTLDTETMTDESREAFTEALEAAQAVAAKEDASQAEADQAASKLVLVIDGLDRKKEFPQNEIASDRIAVALPAPVEGLIYSGEEQTGLKLPKDAPYTVEGDKAADAGIYTAILKLNDPEKYIWADGTVEDKAVTWSIGKYTPTIALSPEELTVVYGYGDSVNFGYNGDAEIAAVSQDGTIANAAVGTMDRFSVIYVNPAAAGETVVTVVSAENNNYYAASCDLKVTVLPQPVAIPEAKTGLVYDGTVQTGVVSANEAVYVVGNAAAADAGEYVATAVLLDQRNYIWSNNESTDQAIGWKIDKRGVVLIPETLRKTYASADPVLTALTVNGAEGVAPSYIVTREEGEAVGSYTVTVTPTEDPINNNYTISCRTGNFIIEPAPVAVPQGLILYYTGGEQCGVAKDVYAPYTVTNDIQTLPGNYTATVLLNDTQNYCWADGTTAGKAIQWSIVMPGG